MSVVFYGYGPNPTDLYVATGPALAELTNRVEAWMLVADRTWEEIRDALSGQDKALYPYARDLLAGALLNAYDELRTPDGPIDLLDDWWPPRDRPDDTWIPDIPLPSDSDAAIDSQPGLEKIDDPDLPNEIAKFAKVGTNMLSGDVREFASDDLADIVATAKRLGLEIRHDQPAFDRCRWDLLGW